MSKKFKVGQRVTMSKNFAEYILSDYGQEAYFPPNGKHSESTELTHDNNTTLAMLVAIGAKPVGEVVLEHYPNSDCHNYKVRFDVGYGKFTTNIAPADLRPI